MLLNIFTIANSENLIKLTKNIMQSICTLILQQEKNKHYVTMIKHCRFIFNCVSKSVNCVSA